MKSLPLIYFILDNHVQAFGAIHNVNDELLTYIHAILDNEITKYSKNSYYQVIKHIDEYLSNLNPKDLELYLYEFQQQEEHLLYCINGEEK